MVGFVGAYHGEFGTALLASYKARSMNHMTGEALKFVERLFTAKSLLRGNFRTVVYRSGNHSSWWRSELAIGSFRTWRAIVDPSSDERSLVIRNRSAVLRHLMGGKNFKFN